MIYLYKTNGVITVGEDGKVPVTYYGRGGKSGKFYPLKSKLADDEVIIGNQIWKNINLDTTTYNNGDSIPKITNITDWNNATEGAWCYPEFDDNNQNFGKLYNGYASQDARGITPNGWHIPTQSEFDDLNNFIYNNIDNQVQHSLSIKDSYYWLNYQYNTNVTNFCALGSSYPESSYGLKLDTRFFCSDISIPGLFLKTEELNESSNVFLLNASTLYNEGASIRLIKDDNNLYNGFLINIGGDSYQVVWENLVIDGTSPTSFSDANNLLLNLFS